MSKLYSESISLPRFFVVTFTFIALVVVGVTLFTTYTIGSVEATSPFLGRPGAPIPAAGGLPVFGGFMIVMCALMVVSALLAVAIPLTIRLRIEETEAGLVAGVFPITSRAPLPWNEIKAVEVARPDAFSAFGVPALAYSGVTQIRFRGVATGVLVQLVSGGRIMIGSRRPEELAAAIRARIGPAA